MTLRRVSGECSQVPQRQGAVIGRVEALPVRRYIVAQGGKFGISVSKAFLPLVGSCRTSMRVCRQIKPASIVCRDRFPNGLQEPMLVLAQYGKGALEQEHDTGVEYVDGVADLCESL